MGEVTRSLDEADQPGHVLGEARDLNLAVLDVQLGEIGAVGQGSRERLEHDDTGGRRSPLCVQRRERGVVDGSSIRSAMRRGALRSRAAARPVALRDRRRRKSPPRRRRRSRRRRARGRPPSRGAKAACEARRGPVAKRLISCAPRRRCLRHGSTLPATRCAPSPTPSPTRRSRRAAPPRSSRRCGRRRGRRERSSRTRPHGASRASGGRFARARCRRETRPRGAAARVRGTQSAKTPGPVRPGSSRAAFCAC